MTSSDQAFKKIHPRSEQENLLHRITTRIRQSLQLQEILQATVTEVRKFLETDRVMVYQFHPDEHGEVIAESVEVTRLPSLLGLHFPADDIPPEARQLFLTARQRSIVDLAAQKIGFSALRPGEFVGSVVEEDIRYRPVDPCHAEYLQVMGVQSSVVLPILEAEKLWGLLVAHHSEPRSVPESELQLLQLVVDQVGIAIAQANLLSRLQVQAKRESTANQLATLLHSGEQTCFQTALKAAVVGLSGSGGRLFLIDRETAESSTVYCWGEQPNFATDHKLLEHYYLWQQAMVALPASEAALNQWAIADLYHDARFRTLSACFRPTQIRGVLIVPLRTRQQLLGCLTVFRPEIETERLWAGQFDPDTRQEMPRQSFAVWREEKKGQSQPWTLDDLTLALSLSHHFVLAIAEHQLQTEIQMLNAGLEQQVQARTAELQHTNQQLQIEIAERRQAEAKYREKAQQLEETLNELRETQSQLVQTEKMSSLGQLVAGVAHEINNPVNFIYGNLAYANGYMQDLLHLLTLYQKHYPQPHREIVEESEAIELAFLQEDLPKLLASMKIGADRIQKIVLALRNFSRMDESDVKPVDIHEGLDSTLLILQNRLKASPNHAEIRVIKDYAKLPLVECYAGQLNQVFMNILANAIDALMEYDEQRSRVDCQQNPSTIKIQTLLMNDQQVQIRIADNGPGIPAKVKERLFEPFFTTKPVGKGTGLGLSISYQVVVEKHQGRLACHSHPGEGAEFVIDLPLNLNRLRAGQEASVLHTPVASTTPS